MLSSRLVFVFHKWNCFNDTSDLNISSIDGHTPDMVVQNRRAESLVNKKCIQVPRVQDDLISKQNGFQIVVTNNNNSEAECIWRNFLKRT